MGEYKEFPAYLKFKRIFPSENPPSFICLNRIDDEKRGVKLGF